MYLVGFPLLLIPFVIYNIFVFLFGVNDWTTPHMTIHIISGGEWGIAFGDFIITLSILLLFVEILKSTRIGTRGLIDHMLSMLLFIGLGLEFLLVQQAATSTFFQIVVCSFVDVLGGFTVTVRTAQRDIGIASTPSGDV